MDETLAIKWETLPFNDVLQGLLRGLSSKEANSYADELRKIKFKLTDPVDSSTINEWVNDIATLDSKYESYLEEIKDEEEENKSLVKIQTDKFSGHNASKGLKRLKQLLAGKKIDNIEELTTQVAIILRDEKKHCLAARYWGYEIPKDKCQNNKMVPTDMSDIISNTPENINSKDDNSDGYRTKHIEKIQSEIISCSACGNKKHNRDQCRFLRNNDEEANYCTIVPWAESNAGKKCRDKYGWTQLPPSHIRSKLVDEKEKK